MDLLEVLELSESYTQNTLIPVMAKGAWTSEEEFKSAVTMFSLYSGLDELVIQQYNLDVPTSFFWKDLGSRQLKRVVSD